jgi:integrase
MGKTVPEATAGPWILAAPPEKCILGKAPGLQTSESEPPQQPPTKCPECNSLRNWKDGLRYIKNETGTTTVQRYICRDCGRRFSETNPRTPSTHRQKPSPEREKDVDLFGSYLRPNTSDYKANGLTLKRQVCVTETQGAKNLAKVKTRQEKAQREGTKPDPATVKGKIVKFIWELEKQGLKDISIETYEGYLQQLIKNGANLLDPESVKEVIAKQKKWSENTKALAIASYSKFLEVHGGNWTPPKHKHVRKLPFIPLESEIDQLITGANRKLATFLKILKETGMRRGEALRLKWTDIDFEKGAITLNEPEKNGKPRTFKITSNLIAMLNVLPKQNELIFGGQNPRNFGRIFGRYRKRIAFKLQNPRLMRISFHTFRHWKATTEYHKTKDILHVMQMLGHRDIKTTLIYTQLIHFESDEWHSATAKTTEEAAKLVDAGFEYVCTTPEDIMLFRKRK